MPALTVPITRRFYALLFMLTQIIALAKCQAIDEDKIDLSVMPGYKDLDSCVKCFIHDCWDGLAYAAGCETNGCLCRPGKMGAVIPVLSSGVVNKCKDLDDATLAVAFYTNYCSTKGFTAMPVSPTILQPTGAFTETTTMTATATATVTAAVTTVTVYVQISAAQPLQMRSWGTSRLVMIVGAVVAWALSI